MAYKSQFSGEDIDRILAKGNSLKTIDSGCVKLPSDENSPVDLNTLTATGYYYIEYHTNGPEGVDTPITVLVQKDVYTDITIQYVRYGEYIEQRLIDKDNTTKPFGDWKPVSVDKINIGGGLNLEYPIWFDTDTNTFKIRSDDGTTFSEIKSTRVMDKATYDPDNKNTNIYTYVDNKINETNVGAVQLDFDSHVKDSNIHVTKAQKDKWDSSLTEDELASRITNIKSDIHNKIVAESNNIKGQFPGVSTKVNQLESKLNNHIKDTTKHPTAEQIESWNNKADKNHKHLLGNDVSINISNITGEIPLERIPKEALERLHEVNTKSDLFTLTKETVQNGDSVYIKDENTFYYVIDDTKLNQAEGYKLFSVPVKLTWDSIKNKPTTAAGYGITDYISKIEYDLLIAPIKNKMNLVDKLNNQFGPILDISYERINNALTKLSAIDYNKADVMAVLDKADQFEDSVGTDLNELVETLAAIDKFL